MDTISITIITKIRSYNSIIDRYGGKAAFDVIIITRQDLNEGKPNPYLFRAALTKLELTQSETLLVENAPLGVSAANNAESDAL